MARVVRVRVELKNKWSNDPMRNLKEMVLDLRRKVSDAVLHSLREHERYESRGEKVRRKKREAVSKFRMEELEKKVLAGERVKAPAGLIKKILEKANKRKPNDEE